MAEIIDRPARRASSMMRAMQKFQMLGLSMTLVAALLAGCKKGDDGGGGGGGGKVASCLASSGGSCREYRGGNLALGTENLTKLCTALDKAAKFAEVPCPTDKVAGRCKKPEGTDVYYPNYEMPLDKAEKYCTEGGGTFSK